MEIKTTASYLKRYFVIGIILFGFVATAWGESAYIGEVLKITLRRGPGTDYKVTDMISSGTAVEILEKNPDWTHVRILDDKDKEGWVLTRFISDQEPCAARLAKLQTELDAAGSAQQDLSQRNQALNQQIETLKTELGNSVNELKALQESHTKLSSTASGSVAVQRAYDQSQDQLAQTKNQLAQAQNQLAEIKRQMAEMKKPAPEPFFTTEIKWFLIGGGVFLLGLVLGSFNKRRKRKPTLLI